MDTVHVLNGPNLDLLGTREPQVYGAGTHDDVERLCRATADDLGVAVVVRQSNHEGQLIDWLHEAGAAGVLGVVLNAGGLTHTSIALRDAVAAIGPPVVECHVSNVHAREPFRHHSWLSAVARGVVVGFGIEGYGLAIRGLVAVSAGGSRG